MGKNDGEAASPRVRWLTALQQHAAVAVFADVLHRWFRDSGHDWRLTPDESEAVLHLLREENWRRALLISLGMAARSHGAAPQSFAALPPNEREAYFGIGEARMRAQQVYVSQDDGSCPLEEVGLNTNLVRLAFLTAAGPKATHYAWRGMPVVSLRSLPSPHAPFPGEMTMRTEMPEIAKGLATPGDLTAAGKSATAGVHSAHTAPAPAADPVGAAGGRFRQFKPAMNEFDLRSGQPKGTTKRKAFKNRLKEYGAEYGESPSRGHGGIDIAVKEVHRIADLHAATKRGQTNKSKDQKAKTAAFA